MLKLKSKLSCPAKNLSRRHKTTSKRPFKPRQMLPKKLQKNRRKNSHRKCKNPIRLKLRFKRTPLRRLMLEKLRPPIRKIAQRLKRNQNPKKAKIRLSKLVKLLCKPIRLLLKNQLSHKNLKASNP